MKEPVDTPLKNPRVAARIVDNKALVVVVDNHRLHTLNGVGTRIWALCDGRTVDDITEALVGEFDVAPEIARRDVSAFVAELRSTGALLPQEVGG